MPSRILVKRGDITKEEVEVIVNAANSTLLGGGGVDGMIHGAAGPELLDECAALGGCACGEAKLTKGYDLPARFIIHTVGPIYGHEGGREDALLSDCYRNSLELAKEYGLSTIAFPCISTGVFRFPKDRAALIAVSTVRRFVDEHPGAFREIRFIVFEEKDHEIYLNLLSK